MSVATGRRPIDLDAKAALTALRRARRRPNVSPWRPGRLVQVVQASWCACLPRQTSFGVARTKSRSRVTCADAPCAVARC
jgi:hypothetical protein